jgi:8-oxo-dGTP pyrophosphatase MutT (NUDIX family)
MPNSDFPIVDASVALILDDVKQKFLWTWNPRWRSFSLPVSRLRPWNGIRGAHMAAAAQEAAERAAAEAIGVPVVVHHACRLNPILERSGRDGRLKSFTYEAFRASAHEEFAGRTSPQLSQIWLAGHEALSGDFRPLAPTSVEVISQLVELGLVPGRRQLASTVLLARGPDDSPEYLMRPNPDWGYFFPSKRRSDGESAAAAAEQAVKQELGLEPGVTVTLRLVANEPLTYYDRSDSAETATFYVHTLFTATLNDGARLNGREELLWVPLADISTGQTATPKTLGGTDGPAGKVSRTAHRILKFAGHF